MCEIVRKSRGSLQVAMLLNYLAMDNHVSTVRGSGLNVSILVYNQEACVRIKVLICVSVYVFVHVYGCTLSNLVALISHFLSSVSLWELCSPLHLPCYAV